MGWKINVLDECHSAQASELDEVYVKPDDVVAEPSINYETKLLPNENFLQKHEKDLIKHHNMNETPPKVLVDFQKNTEIHKLIAEGIKTAEALEESIIKNTSLASLNPSANLKPTGNSEGKDDPEMIDAVTVTPKNQEVKLYPGKPMMSSSGLPVFLRPPSPNYQGYRPLNLPIRRPIAVERRPVNRPQRPYLLPQSSMIVNQYKKPLMHYGMREMMKSKPMKPQASILLLGEPTEIKPFKKNLPEIMHKPVMPFTENTKFKKNDGAYPPRPMKYQMKTYKNPVRNSFNDPFQIKNESNTFKSAQNTGFKPDSVIVEGGFKPIYRREDVINLNEESEEVVKVSNRRRDDFISDIDEAIESDAFLINNDEPVRTLFEPMFIPSPLDSIALAQVKNNRSDINSDMLVEDGEDKIAEANERQDYFYLPPDSHANSHHLVLDSKKAVKFDAKAVLDTSLLSSDPVYRNDFVALSSKTKQFIKDTPQFGPFKGEIPKEISLQISGDKSADVIELKGKNPISTKLSVVKF